MKRDQKDLKNISSARIRTIIYMILSCMFFACISAPVYGDDWETAEGREQNTHLTADLIGYKEGYSAILYDNSNGLPTSEANDIVQSDDGFLWIGSYAGLIRYDGNTFERLDSSTGITSVKCLHYDTKGRLWIGTNESGVFLMEKNEFRSWSTDDGLGSASIRAIAEDPDGRIYIGSTGGVSVMDENLNVTDLNEPELESQFIQSLTCGLDGKIYGLTNDGDGFVLEEGRMIAFLSHYNRDFGIATCLCPDPDTPGYIYYETINGMMLHADYKNIAGTASYIETGNLAQTLNITYSNKRLWFCCRNGIGVLDQGKIVPLENVPMDNSATDMTTDYEGNLWFVSTRQGVMKIVPNQFTDIFAKYGLEKAVVNSTCFLEGNFYIATDDGLIVIDQDGNRLDNIPIERARFASEETFVEGDPFNLISMLEGTRLRSLSVDSEGRLWISAWRQYGVICYDHGTMIIYSDTDGLFSNNVRRVEECEDGTYIVAVTGGVNVIKDGKVIAGYANDDGIANTEILTVEPGKNGDILCGSDGGGIFILTDHGTIHIGKEEGLTSEAVMRIKYDELHDIYWVVTGNSLAWLSSDYQLHIIKNFPYANNFDLYKGKNDMLWILSSNGIYVTSAVSLLNDSAKNPLHYGIPNGLPCIATANSYSWVTDEGDLYIAGSTGVAKVNINTPYVNISNLKASIPYIEADGEMLYPDKDGGFTIDSSVRKVTIHPYVFNYSLIDPQVTYRLKGFDTTFTTVKRSDLMPVTYTNLSSGEYSFVIQLVDQMGGGNKVMSVRITKIKALMENAWVYALIFLAVVLLGIIGVRTYVRFIVKRLEKRHRLEKENERIMSELNMAGGIQQSMLPHKFPPYPDRNEFSIYAYMRPAKEVGGDFYDYFLIDDDHLCLVIADVSGKGIPAALFMMMSKIIVQTYATTGISAAEILSKANDTISDNNPVEMFVTVWLGILEISTGVLKAANAGHEYPYVRKNGQFSMLKDKHGFIIGGMKDISYKEYEVQLEPGDCIFVYTDGVPEAANAAKEMFKTDRLLIALNKEPQASVEKILTNVNHAVHDFVKDAEQFDDLTMLCLEYHGKEN